MYGTKFKVALTIAILRTENVLDLVVDISACNMVRARRLRADQNRDVSRSRLQCHCHAESSRSRNSRRCRFYLTDV